MHLTSLQLISAVRIERKNDRGIRTQFEDSAILELPHRHSPVQFNTSADLRKG